MTKTTTRDTTNDLRITNELRKQINAAVRTHTTGASPLAEVGLRGDARCLPNALKWASDSDLGDMTRLRDMKTIDADDRFPGCFELDLYVTTGPSIERELETNVCILIRDGQVVGATSKGLRIVALKQSIGFPLGDWDDAPTTPIETHDVVRGDGRVVRVTVPEDDARPDFDTRDREGDATEPPDALEAAKRRAQHESTQGYVQHVNRSGDGYVVSDWCDGSTVASFENGREL